MPMFQDGMYSTRKKVSSEIKNNKIKINDSNIIALLETKKKNPFYKRFHLKWYKNIDSHRKKNSHNIG